MDCQSFAACICWCCFFTWRYLVGDLQIIKQEEKREDTLSTLGTEIHRKFFVACQRSPLWRPPVYVEKVAGTKRPCLHQPRSLLRRKALRFSSAYYWTSPHNESLNNGLRWSWLIPFLQRKILKVSEKGTAVRSGETTPVAKPNGRNVAQYMLQAEKPLVQVSWPRARYHSDTKHVTSNLTWPRSLILWECHARESEAASDVSAPVAGAPIWASSSSLTAWTDPQGEESGVAGWQGQVWNTHQSVSHSTPSSHTHSPCGAPCIRLLPCVPSC